MAKPNARVLAAALALIACAVLFSSDGASAITCEKVATTVAGCIRYIQSGGTMPPACCSGARNLNTLSTAEKQQACSCLKTIVKSIQGMNPDNLASIPSKCGINLGFKIALSTDCSTVK